MPVRVVSNTSPVQYLHTLGLLTLLPRLYGSILVPGEVVDELAQGIAAGLDLPLLGRFDWVQVPSPVSIDPRVRSLGKGEAAAISLALEVGADLLLLDDLPARRLAQSLGIPLAGTLGILLRAKEAGLLSKVAPYLPRLRDCGFRVSSPLEEAVLNAAGELPDSEGC